MSKESSQYSPSFFDEKDIEIINRLLTTGEVVINDKFRLLKAKIELVICRNGLDKSKQMFQEIRTILFDSPKQNDTFIHGGNSSILLGKHFTQSYNGNKHLGKVIVGLVTLFTQNINSYGIINGSTVSTVELIIVIILLSIFFEFLENAYYTPLEDRVIEIPYITNIIRNVYPVRTKPLLLTELSKSRNESIQKDPIDHYKNEIINARKSLNVLYRHGTGLKEDLTILQKLRDELSKSNNSYSNTIVKYFQSSSTLAKQREQEEQIENKISERKMTIEVIDTEIRRLEELIQFMKTKIDEINSSDSVIGTTLMPSDTTSNVEFKETFVTFFYNTVELLYKMSFDYKFPEYRNGSKYRNVNGGGKTKRNKTSRKKTNRIYKSKSYLYNKK